MITHNKKVALAVALCLSGLMLGGCGSKSSSGGGSSGSTAPASTTVTGTAATGNPIVNATVTLSCSNTPDSVSDPTTVTTAQGTYSFAGVKASYMPCEVEVAATSNSPVLHSLITGSSGGATTANITPLTEMVFAKAIYNAGLTNTTINNWLDSNPTPAQITAVVNAVPGAVTAVATAINAVNAGTDLPAGFNPMTQGFTADGASQYDKILDALKTALGTTTVQAFLASVDYSNSNLTLPSINVVIINDGSGGTGGTGSLGISVSINGIVASTATVKNIGLPADQSAFCDMDAVKSSLPSSGVSNLQCSFSGHTGTLSWTFNPGVQGAPTQNFVATYTFSA